MGLVKDDARKAWSPIQWFDEVETQGADTHGEKTLRRPGGLCRLCIHFEALESWVGVISNRPVSPIGALPSICSRRWELWRILTAQQDHIRSFGGIMYLSCHSLTSSLSTHGEMTNQWCIFSFEKQESSNLGIYSLHLLSQYRLLPNQLEVRHVGRQQELAGISDLITFFYLLTVCSHDTTALLHLTSTSALLIGRYFCHHVIFAEFEDHQPEGCGRGFSQCPPSPTKRFQSHWHQLLPRVHSLLHAHYSHSLAHWQI
jgi:hypothetical protein